MSPLGKLRRSKTPHSQGAGGGPLLSPSTSVLADQREKKHPISRYLTFAVCNPCRVHKEKSRTVLEHNRDYISISLWMLELLLPKSLAEKQVSLEM